jgi:hypothetical protein
MEEGRKLKFKTGKWRGENPRSCPAATRGRWSASRGKSKGGEKKKAVEERPSLCKIQKRKGQATRGSMAGGKRHELSAAIVRSCRKNNSEFNRSPAGQSYDGDLKSPQERKSSRLTGLKTRYYEDFVTRL